MDNNEFLMNSTLLAAAYIYIILVILVAGKLSKTTKMAKYSRKFLHMMIGNLVFLIPFFSFNSFPVNFPFFVAAPFIVVTFLASSFCPFKVFNKKMEGLSKITDKGHQTGLIFYALSYTVLAGLFSSQPYLIAVGILSMSYGDAFASIIGEKFGKPRSRFWGKKTYEGSLGMFLATLLFVAVCLLYMSVVFVFPVTSILPVGLAVAFVATIAEALTPRGLDNITVPALTVLVSIILLGGI